MLLTDDYSKLLVGDNYILPIMHYKCCRDASANPSAAGLRLFGHASAEVERSLRNLLFHLTERDRDSPAGLQRIVVDYSTRPFENGQTAR
jgi:hypothetical protein